MNSPYGLPCVENCLTCHQRSENFFCALRKESLEVFNQMKHVTSVCLLAAAASVLLLVLASATPGLSQTFGGVLTEHNDNLRTGQNLNETVLTPLNVNSSRFGKLFSYSVDGQIYAQPLYVPNVKIPGQGTHNVVYVATQNDTVYAFDADGLSSVPLWQDSFISPAQTVAPVSCQSNGKEIMSCAVFPIYGITGTPVIDPGTNTMFLVARTLEKGKYFQRLHALDTTTGTEKLGGPVLVQASAPGTGVGSVGGVVPFSERQDIQRAGLLLLNGTIYVGWAGAEHGWIMGYDATTLAQVEVFTPTPNAARGGIWQSGSGLAADDLGNIYAAIGDGVFDVDTGGTDYGDSLLQLSGSLSVLDYFAPMDQACRLTNDLDLGSAGPMLLPTQPGSVSNELVIAGKGGDPCDQFGQTGATPIYLLDQGNLGKYNPTQDQVVETVAGAPGGYWSNPAYWQGQTASNLYIAGLIAEDGTGDYLKMYSVSNGVLSTSPVAQSANIFPIGATPSISANGTSDGIVWAIERHEGLGIQHGQKPAILYAYDATNVSTMLYNSAQVVARDQGGCASKFQVPTIANGKVYVSTQNELDVFGLLGPLSSAPNVFLLQPCDTFLPQAISTTSPPRNLPLTNSGSASLMITRIAITGTNPGEFAQTNNCKSSLPAGKSCTITVTFTPTAIGARTAYVLITDNAAGSPHNVYLLGRGQ
ncbi:MAG TPA: choice-of-anchor D domain-containing protein [Terriglobales bacterium]|nr:choice-of-anchor D domain-containing protein [Terriglobales bacterium]